uniref:Uncharacterized protein n=1 Tax=Glossina morsitans morsitans TaxID=37546 RepID=A0ABK9NFX2_GLOMM
MIIYNFFFTLVLTILFAAQHNYYYSLLECSLTTKLSSANSLLIYIFTSMLRSRNFMAFFFNRLTCFSANRFPRPAAARRAAHVHLGFSLSIFLLIFFLALTGFGIFVTI